MAAAVVFRGGSGVGAVRPSEGRVQLAIAARPADLTPPASRTARPLRVTSSAGYGRRAERCGCPGRPRAGSDTSPRLRRSSEPGRRAARKRGSADLKSSLESRSRTRTRCRRGRRRGASPRGASPSARRRRPALRGPSPPGDARRIAAYAVARVVHCRLEPSRIATQHRVVGRARSCAASGGGANGRAARGERREEEDDPEIGVGRSSRSACPARPCRMISPSGREAEPNERPMAAALARKSRYEYRRSDAGRDVPGLRRYRLQQAGELRGGCDPVRLRPLVAVQSATTVRESEMIDDRAGACPGSRLLSARPAGDAVHLEYGQVPSRCRQQVNAGVVRSHGAAARPRGPTRRGDRSTARASPPSEMLVRHRRRGRRRSIAATTRSPTTNARTSHPACSTTRWT